MKNKKILGLGALVIGIVALSKEKTPTKKNNILYVDIIEPNPGGPTPNDPTNTPINGTNRHWSHNL